MHPALSLNLLCFADTTLQEDLDFCAEAGFHQVGIPFSRLAAEGLDKSVEAVRQTGLALSTVGVGALFDMDRPNRWNEQAEKLTLVLDTAAALRAHTVYGHAGPALSKEWSDAAAALAEAAQDVVAHGAKVGVPLVIEPTNPLYADTDFVHSFRDAVDLAGITGLGLCLDLFHIWEERDLLGTVARGIQSIHLVQLGDFSLGTRQVPGRVVPGDGVMPIRKLLGGAVDAGYDGPFDLELLGPRIVEEGARAAALRSGRYMTDVLYEIGV